MPDINPEDLKVDASSRVEEHTPLTKMLDEFLKERASGTVENAKEAFSKPKEEHEHLNDRMNPRYKRWDGREALQQIEAPKDLEVTSVYDENHRAVSFSNEKRECSYERVR